MYCSPCPPGPQDVGSGQVRGQGVAWHEGLALDDDTSLQGHLSRYLAHKYGLSVTGVEGVGGHLTTAAKYDK